MAKYPKIIVFDDDPTGSQTVHSCLLLLQWDVETLRVGLRDPSPLLFILTNTRANPPTVAAQITQEVCRNLKAAVTAEAIQDYLVVSRSDSTLRGHYPLETDIIAQELGPFDAHFLVPAFLEGGRITQESIHYVLTRGKRIPVEQTEFAQDPVFGFQHSYLPDYVAEKTQGRITASQVERFLEPVELKRLLQLKDNQCVVVDAQVQTDLDQFAVQVLQATQQGKRFLFRSAASLLTALAQLPPQPVPAEQIGQYRRSVNPGIFIVGSHVQKTTQQLSHLLKQPETIGIEIDVARLSMDLSSEVMKQVRMAYEQGKTLVVFTSRQALSFADAETQLQFGQTVSSFLTTIVHNLPEVGYLVSKGGITSNAILTEGLQLKQVRLLGQVLPGCCLVRTAAEHPTFPELPVVLCPGNVGEIDTLTEIYERFRAYR
ncbi:hypothetical protein C1752_06146 [Acaryochloris thomasi RCC1774]|uniref:Hrp-dependent type III effector protein n=1 Tax=Acaryochloris thomasi RCC1774 TaxID=1764569 RepID=A0A2W1JCH3_9CYAN|nr:four-carbon acid sugar kinase family protein [Acaryochloris thomasi]PZD71526.1 hypothetical protein C1752_06146 [Acaryochloris thomasi RCC1774]